MVSLDTGVHLPTARGTIAKFTPASVDPRMAELIARNSTGTARLMRFTPAGVAERASRSMTVAVRVDEDVARAISVRSALAAATQDQAPASAPALPIAPTRFNLGVARGYQSFAKAPAPASAVAIAPTAEGAIPDIATLRASTTPRETPSRFVARTVSDVPAPAAAPRAVEPAKVVPGESVDVAGSYRLTRNLDVTAGWRYSQDRERLVPLADPAKQDSQAVYVGTQFRF